MKPISEISPLEAKGVKYILMDIDDTLTKDGKLLAASYNALWKLNEASLKVIPVTGRPAGWCDLIAREWPVHGVVGENGALAFWEEDEELGMRNEEWGTGNREQRAGNGERGKRHSSLKTMFHGNAIRNDHPVLRRVVERAFGEFPELRLAKDQFARLFDMAMDFAEEDPVLPLSVAQRVKAIAEEEGAMAKISSIHVNIWMGKYDKLSMAEDFLSKRFGWIRDNANEVIFVGDSPNDEPMFVRFPLACAVANIKRYSSLISHYPAYVATKECGEGFAEIAETLLEKR
ncbi:MAG: HAD-IIB family hydrolase [Treponema sp.]|jgi:HAD superfamily hydrolase (TIGR01484 family)|nr:HAD-IIB family hydrolase [Treponema sp.]